MSRYTGPKRRLSKREGVALFPKDARPLERKGAVPPGMRGTRIRPRTSEYGVQLRSKQRARRLYGLSEKQFKNTYSQAAKNKKATGESLLELLETRLDNIVYRLGFASSRPEARQLVSHGHILVNNKRVNIPSYKVGQNSIVAIASNFVHNTQVKKSLAEKESVPGWLERKATVGKVVRLPEKSETEGILDEQLIVEYYSR